MITINWATRVITVPQANLTLVSGSLYELDVDSFRLLLKDIEDSDEGMTFPDTHRHNTVVSLSGVTFARTFEIINGYTITFENGTYSVRCVGANHNIGDVKNVNSVSLIIGNSAGLIESGGGTSAVDIYTYFTTGGREAAFKDGVNAIAAAVWGYVIESGMTSEQMIRVLAAVSAGVTSISLGPPVVLTFKGIDGVTDRAKFTMVGSTRTDADLTG